MAKVKIDFKAKGQVIANYFKEKGEKVGLGVCLAIMLLFGGLGLWGSFSAPSPVKNAADMKKLADDKSQAFKRAEPGENDNPGPENSSTKLAALDKLDPTAYRGRQMFSESEFLDVKRRPPAILTVDDAKVSLARVAVKSYMFNKDGKSLTVIKGGATAMAGGGAAGIPSGKGNAVQAKDQAIRLFAAKKNAPKATSEGTKYSDRLIAYLKNLEFSGRKMAETLTVTSDEYEKMKGSYRPAEQALPLRMAIVNASFPYKAQMEEFRNKLKLGSFAEVLNDATASPEDPNVGVNAFRFLGMNVERRKKTADGKWEDWKPLDIRGNYLPFATSTDFRFEPEDPSIADFIVNGLMMPKLRAFDPEHYPKVDDAELSLAKIKSQVDESARKDKDKLKQSKPRTKQDTFDVFSPAPVASGTTGEGPGMAPLAFNPNGTVGAGGFVPGAPAMMMPGLAQGQDVEPAVHNLVRFIDVDIQPGETYEYRVQIRMGNPNYKRTKDVASPAYAEGAELLSEWSKIPMVLNLPEEQSCFLIDQRKEDEKTFKGFTSEDSKRQVPMQIHKWFLNTGAATQNLSVGDWAVAERVSVFRGEFVGRQVIAKIPLWIYFFEGFGLLPPKIVKGGTAATKTGDGILVDFSPDRKDRPDFLLVDFEGPEYTHDRVKTAGPDAKPVVSKVEERDRLVEAYIINPLGQLEVHNIVSDRDNATRKAMLEAYRIRVKKAEDFMRGGGAGGTTPFGS